MSEEKEQATGGKAKNVLLGMGLAVVIIVVATVGGLLWIGLSTPVEEYVNDIAQRQNELKGKQIDEVTRLDSASAEGALLRVRHTLSDGWFGQIYEAQSATVAQQLGHMPSEEEMLQVIEIGLLAGACKLRPELVHADARVVHEYHDEQGELLLSVEGNEGTCKELAELTSQ